MNRLSEDLLEIKDFFSDLRKGVRKEQKEMFFQPKNDKDKTEYFDFLKFLFSSPSKA